jgi:transcriptional regulator with XRE-family HTH domain
MTQEQLSFGAGITQTFLSQVETGRRNVSIDTLEKLAVVLEIDIVELLLS